MARNAEERAKTACGGFTLLEVIMVMMLMLVILGVSAAFMANMLPSQNLNAAGRELSAMLRFGRLLAMNSGEPMTVFIDLDRGRYGIRGVQTRNVPHGIAVRVTDPLEGEITHGEYSVLFNESGGADWGRITLSGGRRALHIELDPVLGAVTLK